MPLADTLLRLASGRRLYLPKWTDQIMTEVNRNLVENFGLTDEQVAYRESEIRRHFPEAWVEGYEDLVSAMTNHPKDRHILAAAVRCNAEVIVTQNVKDFPRTSLEPYSITVMGPSTFLRNLYDLDPGVIASTLLRQAASINKPVEYVLERLSVNAPAFVSFFKATGAGREAGLGE
ncbi:MAG: PIN domain-containing protein [Acidobacteria bacterium]|nr:PIN domain-containing protein [Acidobacteriota bacterium]